MKNKIIIQSIKPAEPFSEKQVLALAKLVETLPKGIEDKKQLAEKFSVILKDQPNFTKEGFFKSCNL